MKTFNEKHILGLKDYWEAKVFESQFWGFIGGMVLGVLIALIWLQ